MKRSQRLAAFSVACVLAAVSLSALAAGPSWWMNRGVLTTNGVVVTNDVAPATLGQLKWMATKAREEFDYALPGGASTGVNGMVNGFVNSTNFAPALVGQGKRVAQPFHDQLATFGYTNGYPWSGTNKNDFAPLLIGQLKTLFNFDPGYNDGSGMPQWWLMKYFGHTGFDPNGDADLDGLSNLAEYQYGTNPSAADTTPPSFSITYPANGAFLP